LPGAWSSTPFSVVHPDALDPSGRVQTAVSNILKMKHDTVKNSISNVR